MADRKIIVIAGPTACGKTEYAIRVAQHVDGEVVSCDSMQLYKYMSIGSAKPTPEEQAAVRHWLVDEIDPRDEFSVARYRDMAKEAINDIISRGKVPVIAGGTGLYLNSLLYDMDFSDTDKDAEFRNTLMEEAELFGPEYVHKKLEAIDPVKASKIHPNNLKKVIRALEGASMGKGIADFRDLNKRTEDYDVLLIGLTRDRAELYDRINRRVDIMVEQGLFEEVRDLLEMGLQEEDISMKGIGYKEIIAYFDGVYPKEEAIGKIKQNTRHLAKRQLTWFRRYEDMHWVNISELGDEGALDEVLELSDNYLR
ncbi:MAG: tRNA (adenosine(37)-N6)-dimethylallyltransferase MiaA [Firmicutes bacterium]|nr:tRNA (adenosine(37)-N6)-dimethylallyltransferase MiaA [Bacillota bacterium]